MPKTSELRLARTVVTSPDGHEELFVDIAIDCEVCGQSGGAIAGHHLKTLHAALGLVIAEYPELCGTVGAATETIRFQGSHDPKQTRNN